MKHRTQAVTCDRLFRNDKRNLVYVSVAHGNNIVVPREGQSLVADLSGSAARIEDMTDIEFMPASSQRI